MKTTSLAACLARYLATVCLGYFATGCSSESIARVPNPVRHAFEQGLRTVDANIPLELRFNPAPCNCPAFELQLADRWLRAELTANDLDRLNAWTNALAATPPEALPIAVTVRGKIDRDLQRTAQGAYAVRIDVTEILSPAPPVNPEDVLPVSP